MRNNVPDGDFSALVPPADVEERAGGLTGRVLIEQLRASIRALEQVPVSLSIPPAPGAAPSLPACSLTPPSSASGTADAPSQSPPSNNPLSTLHQAGLHEIKPHAYRDTPAGLGLALSVIADIQRQGPGAVLWCMTQRQAQEWGRPYGPGLLKAGLDPARVLFVEMRNADETAWALEEGLKSAALIAALGQTEIKTPLVARRLGLAARAAGTPCFLLTGHGEAKVPGTLTRWRIATEASAHIPFDTGASFGQGAHSYESAPGPACWYLSLERSRAGAQVARSAEGQTTGPQVGQRPVGQTIREGARFHVQANHGARHEAGRPNTKQVTEGRIEEAAPNGLRVVPASANRETDAGALARGLQAATG